MQDKMEEKIMIAPSIMCISEWQDTKNIFRQLKENGIAMIHADVMDGKFVPNLMLGTESIKHLREVTDIPLDIHMMVENPEEKLDWFDIQPGEYVSVHAESTRHLQRTLAKFIEVDGNVSFENAPKMYHAGARAFVCGTSSIFGKNGSIEENIAKFKKSMEE